MCFLGGGTGRNNSLLFREVKGGVEGSFSNQSLWIIWYTTCQREHIHVEESDKEQLTINCGGKYCM